MIKQSIRLGWYHTIRRGVFFGGSVIIGIGLWGGSMRIGYGQAAPSKGDAAISLAGFYEGTYHYRLQNGLHVFLKQDKKARLTSFHLQVHTGSIHEEISYGSGLSHFFEHSLFLGSKRFPKENSFSFHIESLGGGRLNAYTTIDHTAYYYRILSENTLQGISAMEDLIFHPLFERSKVIKEKGSILAEMDMRSDRPNDYFYSMVSQFAFTNLPYKYPVIGFRDRFDALSVEELLDYYKVRYKPNNMTLVLIGNFELEPVITTIQNTFGQHAKGAIKPLKFQNEATWTSGRMETSHPKSASIDIRWLWEGCSYYDEEIYALDMLAAIMGQGAHSLLYARLKEKLRLVKEVYAYSWTPTMKGIFVIGCSIDPENDPEALRKKIARIEEEIFTIIDDLLKGKIADERLAASRRVLLKELVDSNEDSLRVARNVASSIMNHGGPNYMDLYLKGFRDVQKEDVMQAAQTFLKQKNYKMNLMFPEGMLSEKLYEDSKVVTGDFAKKPIPVSHGEPLPPLEGIQTQLLDDAMLQAAIQQEQEGNAPKAPMKVHKETLPNGITLMVYTDAALPKVIVHLGGLGGLTYEWNAFKNGSFEMWTRMLLTRNKQFSKRQINEYMAQHGIEASASSGNNSFMVQMSYLKDKHSEAAYLLRSIVMNDRYHKKDFKLEKDDLLYDLNNNRQKGWYISGEKFKKLFFKGTPYENPIMGTPESLDTITVKDMRAIRDRLMDPKRLIVSIYGDITPKQAKEHYAWVGTLESASDAETASSQPAYTFEPVAYVDSEGPHEAYEKGFKQAFLRMAYRAPSKEHEDVPALQVLEGYLSGMGGPLFMLRNEPYKGKGGRAYAIGGYYDDNIHYGIFAFYAALRYEAMGEYEWFKDNVHAILKRLKEEPLSKKDLHRAKLNVVGEMIDDVETLSRLSTSHTFNELYGFGYDYDAKNIQKLKQVEAKDVQAVVKKYFTDDGFLMHVVYPKEVNAPN